MNDDRPPARTGEDETGGDEPADAVSDQAVSTEPVSAEPVLTEDEPAEPVSAEPVSTDAVVADGEIRDTLPDDLDASGFVGPYMFPNNSRRRIPGVIYLLLSVVLVVTWGLVDADDSAAVNGGLLAAGIGLALFGAYNLVTGWDLAVDENDALVAATRAAGFPIGHASAQMGWRGLLSRPTWRLLVYSNEPQPTRRGLVLVDGVDGEVLDVFIEDNPEDWSDLEGA